MPRHVPYIHDRGLGMPESGGQGKEKTGDLYAADLYGVSVVSRLSREEQLKNKQFLSKCLTHPFGKCVMAANTTRAFFFGSPRDRRHRSLARPRSPGRWSTTGGRRGAVRKKAKNGWGFLISIAIQVLSYDGFCSDTLT